MKTTFKSPSAFNTTSFNSSSTINVELDSPANVNTEFNSSSNIAADTSNLDVKYLKMVIDKETGRYIKVDTESKPDFIILGLYSATNSFLSSCEFNVTGGVRVIDCSLDLSNKRLIITNSDDAHIYCDLTALLNVIDGKVTSNSPIQGATKTKITYDEKGLVTGGENLVALDIPVLPIGKITGLNDALFDKVQKNEPIIGSTATKITYDEKGLITGGTNLIKGDIPNIDATQVIEDTSHRFITDIEKTKLSGIEPNAEVNIIEAIKIDGADLIPDVDKRITLPNKEPAFAKNTAFNKNFGNEENTVTQGNDARLSDARIPLPHNHDDRYYTESEIDIFFIQRGESEPEVKKGLWLDECVEGVGVDDVIIIKGTDLQVIGNVSGQIPILQANSKNC